ncbi:hypothetical protein MF271_18090 (plasmid) [Deinococcus sp. KNUC1210]|uniref:hypothetical protein n=1 Tax=Deinococcus sp. KNUC1210 TaxID=2917691 RepID=UPI001EF0519C|nr:hypothetical protein [Deinococcus sp. KNUC1210]ULH17270.1 hypothetical protein MF271_18090 [Deinococcus sp. KNUC1210]
MTAAGEKALLCAGLLLLGAVFSESQAASPPVAAPAAAQTAAKKAPNLRVNVYFQKIDEKGMVILKYGSVLLTTRLYGIRLRSGSAGVLSLVLPSGVLLQAEVIEKGEIQSVVLWKGNKNLNEELLIQGVAEGIH